MARALLECGADLEAKDRKGDTPLEQALNCRRDAVAQLLQANRSGNSCRNVFGN
jgi:ankyrin repeat protein